MLAGCSVNFSSGSDALDSQKLEGKVKHIIVSQAGAKVRAVHCPKHRKIKKGDVFYCRAVGTDGSRAAVRVLQTGGGHVDVHAPLLHIDRAETLLRQSLTQKHIRVSQVSCQQLVVGRPGIRFQCRAIAGGQVGRISARVTDTQGHFDYTVRG